jgi:tRNA nucleotidyltransferase (CCA-adding enzyme)
VLDRRRVLHEVTTFRRDVTTDGRHAVVAYGVSLDDDLARRDFTINAIAYHPLRHEWRDPFGGRADLARRTVRAVGDPAQRFREDYLRILRCLRFAARFGFEVDPATWDAAVAAAPGLSQLSAERVRDEWFKGLRTARSVPELVGLWRKVGAAERWIPELAGSTGERESRAGTVPLEGRDPVLLSALLIDDAASVLRRLRASNADIERAAAIARGPAGPAGPDPRAVRQWLSAVGRAADDLLALQAIRSGVPAPWATEVEAVRARRDPLTRGDLAVGGRELQALGLAGPRLGEVLGILLERVLDDPTCNTADALMAIAREMA